MNYKKPLKDPATKPPRGDYPKSKPIVRIECHAQCVYCAIHENQFGGEHNFHVEHYRPKSLPRFRHLRRELSNLYYACSICNAFKGNDWPNDPVDDHSVPSYPDPAVVDYGAIISIDDKRTATGKFVASRYVVERLALNRPQLVKERRRTSIADRVYGVDVAVGGLSGEIATLCAQRPDKAAAIFGAYAEFMERVSELRATHALMLRHSPYEPLDVKRPVPAPVHRARLRAARTAKVSRKR